MERGAGSRNVKIRRFGVTCENAGWLGVMLGECWVLCECVGGCWVLYECVSVLGGVGCGILCGLFMC